MILFSSCTNDENIPQEILQKWGERDTISLTLNYLNVQQSINDTKGALTVNPTQVTDVNIYIFNQQGDIITHSYSNGSTTIRDLVIFSNLKYRVFAIANMGRKLPYKTIAEIEQHKHTISNIGELVDAGGGFLMSGKTDLITLTNNMMLDIPLTRNVAKFVLSCNYINLNTGVTIDIKKVSLKNAPISVYPFKDSKAENLSVMPGESRDITELSDITSGVPFYLYENLQGTVAPAALDNKSKEQGMNSEAKAHSSYLEMEYDYTSPSKKGTIIYRFYIGETHKDCNIRRNTQYNCTVMFKGDGSVDENSWSVDNSGIVDLVTSLSIAPTTHKFTALNEQLSIIATVLPHTANNKVLSWSSSDESIARVDAAGVVTSVADGTCVITATTTDGTNLSASCNIEVNSKIYVTGVTIDPKTLSLFVGEQSQLTGSVTPSNATNGALLWSSSDDAVASVDATGKVTAVANGKCKIKVASADDSSMFDECEVAVNDKTFNLTPGVATLYTTETLQLQWSGVPPGTPTFSSSDNSVATVSAQGLITAIGNGNAEISAVLNGITRTCEVSVVTPRIEFPYLSKVMYEGEEAIIPFSVLVPNTTIPSSTCDNGAIVEILETTSSGVRIRAKGVGSANITASMATAGAVCNIVVQELKIVFNSAAPLNFYQGFNEGVGYTVYPEHARGLAINWSSSNTSALISVNDNIYQGVGANTDADIIATFADHPTKSFRLNAHIKPAISIAENEVNLGANSGVSTSGFDNIHVSYQLTIDKHPRANVVFSGNRVASSGSNVVQCNATGLLSTTPVTTMNGPTGLIATIMNADNGIQYNTSVLVNVYEVCKVWANYQEYEHGPGSQPGEREYYGVAAAQSDKPVGLNFRASFRYNTGDGSIFSVDASNSTTHVQEVARFIDSETYPLAFGEWYYDTIEHLFDVSGSTYMYYYSAKSFGK